MWLLCLLRGHRWFDTVVTHHNACELAGDADWYRGVWHERLCTRCGKEQAVYQKTLERWNVIFDRGHVWAKKEHLPFPGDWAM